MDPVPPAPAQPAPQPQPNTLPETPKPKIWLLGLAGVLLLGVGIVSGVFLGKQLYSNPQPQPVPTPLPSEASAKEGDPTANWKTYQTGNFALRYPDNWHSDDKSDFNRISSAPIDQFEYGILPQDHAVLITQTIYRNKSIPFDSFIGDKPFHPNYKDVTTSSESTLQISGRDSVVIDYEYPREEQKGTVVFIPSGKFLGGGEIIIEFDFYYYNNDPKENQYKELFNLILSTFRFLDSNSNQNYTCPAGEYIDCMPAIGATKPQCDKAYLTWATANCPNFKGAAY